MKLITGYIYATGSVKPTSLTVKVGPCELLFKFVLIICLIVLFGFGFYIAVRFNKWYTFFITSKK